MVRIALVLLLLFVGRFAGVFERKSAEPSSPLLRFAKYYHQLPMLANACLGAPPGKGSDLPVHPDDLDFLRAATRPDERVALLAPFDWLYLMEVGRTPYFHYVHVTHTHSHEFLNRVVAQLDRADRVFVDIDFLPKLADFNPAVHAEITPRLRADFEPVSASHKLTLLRRKSSSAFVHADAR